MYVPIRLCPLIVDALAEVFVRGVIGEPSELVLNCLRQLGVSDDGVLSLLVGKVGVKVGNVQDRFNTGLEWWLIFLGDESNNVV